MGVISSAGPSARILIITTTVVLLVTGFSAEPAGAQVRISRTFTVDQGLVQSQVNALFEDSRGFIWLGTFGGVTRWDGTRFRNFQTQDGLAGMDIRVIRESATGAILIGTYQGISVWDGQELRTTGSLPGTSFSIRDFLFDSAGRFWVATGDGIAVFADADSLDLALHHFLPGKSISSLEMTPRGTILAGTFGDQVFEVEGETATPFFLNEKLPGDRVRDICLAPDGELWISLVRGGLWIASDGGLREWAFNGELQGHDVKVIRRGGDGTLWLGTIGRGAGQVSSSGVKWLEGEHGLPSNTVWDVCSGRDGSVLLGSWGGLAILDRRRIETRNLATGLGADNVLAITGLADGSLAFSCLDRGVTILGPEGSFTITTGQGLADDRVWSLLGTPDGSLYIGTHRGVNVYREGVVHSLFGTGDSMFGRVYAIHACRDGKLLFGSYDGVLTLESDGPRLLYEDPDPGSRVIYDIHEDPDGNLIIGTRHGLVFWRKGMMEKLPAEHPLAGIPVWTIHRGADGHLRYGTAGEGLYYEGPEGLQQLTVSDGMTDNTVYGILEDDSGRLYLSTNRGVNVVDFRSRPPLIRHLGVEAGLASEECNQGAYWQDPEGHFWFGTLGGASRINPGLDRPSPHPPMAVLDRVRLFDDPIPLASFAQVPSFDYHQNYFKFDFAGIHLGGASEVGFRYRMKGIDRDWVISDQDNVQYTALPPSAYEFTVQAKDAWNRWGEPATIRFRITPPFWRTWWFTILAGFFVVGVIALILWQRFRQILALERLRTRIAADLHDDIGAGLTEISILGEVAGSRLVPDQREAVSGELDRIGEVARSLTLGMSDIVWLVRPRNDTTDELLTRLVDHFRPLLQAVGAQLTRKGSPRALRLRLTMEERQHLLRLCKEALHNALKYSQARNVELVVIRRGRHAIIKVCDDGVGFDPETVTRGHGSQTMRQRAEKMGAILEIQSEPGAGTAVLISWRVRKR